MTRDEAKAIIDKEVWPIVNRWLMRADGIAIYENKALDSSMAGEKKLVSFGSKDAMLEVSEPPARLPDIGNAVNWPYQLIGTYRGEILDDH
jgi:hypothetical protein